MTYPVPTLERYVDEIVEEGLSKWELSSDERQQLRSTLSSEGWQHIKAKFEEILHDTREYFYDAKTYDEFLERRGYLDAVERMTQVPDLLLDRERREEMAAVQRSQLLPNFGGLFRRGEKNARRE